MSPQAVIIVALLLTATFAQRADFEMPENQLNRRFSWSTTAPLTRAINELAPEAIPHIALLNHHMTRIEETVLISLKRDRRSPDAIVQPCNPHVSFDYRKSISRAFAVRGFLEPAWTCGSDISGVQVERGEEPGYSTEELYDAVFGRGASIKKRVNEIALRLIDNFTRPEVPFNFTYNTLSAKCVLTPICFYRQGQHWHQGIGIHSHGRDDHVPDGIRNSILEYFRVVNGRLGDNLLLRLPRYDNGSVERVFLENTTTMIQTWSRTPNPSCAIIIPIEENPAVLEALDQADHPAQQVEDAVTSSNLAILLLPLGLNLIPVALFANVSTRVMLLYMIMSDVLTVIPLAIKGVELVIIGANRFRSVVTRVLSPGFRNETWPRSAGGEIWGAECRVREEIGRTGVILIVTSLLFLFIGIVGELLARWYVKRGSVSWLSETERDGKSVSRSSGEISLSMTGTSDSELGAVGVGDGYSLERVDAPYRK